MWKALICSILISEARDIRGQSFASSLGNHKLKTLKCHFELNFNDFQLKMIKKSFHLIATTLSLIGLPLLIFLST